MFAQTQRGATMVLVLVGLVALLGMAGLAIDTAHVLLNKSRLQSALDAAALAGAKALSQSTNTTLATTAANQVFTANLSQYAELNTAVGNGLTMVTDFSSTLNPFSAGTTPANFVRTRITGFTTTMSLVQVLGFTSLNVGGSAVAGASPSLINACNIVPVAVCSSSAVGPPLYGYSTDQVISLNQSAGSVSTIGPGNYGLLAMGGNGASIVEHNLAGDYAQCSGAIGGSLTTEPGVASGPVRFGINTRFNSYGAGMTAAQYPPDTINSTAHQTNLTTDSSGNVYQGSTLVTTGSQLTYNYSMYQAENAAGTYDTAPLPGGTAVFGRRVLAAPLVDCTGLANGRNTVQLNGFMCVFLLQQIPNGGSPIIYGQVIKGCDATGKPGIGAGVVGPYVIELYKSSGSPDS